MPLIDTAKLNFEVIVKGSIAAEGGDAQVTINPLHYIRTNTPAAFSATAFITAFHTLVKADWRAFASLHWTWVSTSIRCINSPTEVAVEVAVGEAGLIAGQMSPSYVAGIISKRTPLRGRSHMGRLYVAGISEGNSDGNALSGAAKTLLDTVATRLKTNVTDANGVIFAPAVLSRLKSNLIIDPSTVYMTGLSNAVARSVLGRQSNRKSLVA
jgi:hypothetical protein